MWISMILVLQLHSQCWGQTVSPNRCSSSLQYWEGTLEHGILGGLHFLMVLTGMSLPLSNYSLISCTQLYRRGRRNLQLCHLTLVLECWRFFSFKNNNLIVTCRSHPAGLSPGASLRMTPTWVLSARYGNEADASWWFRRYSLALVNIRFLPASSRTTGLRTQSSVYPFLIASIQVLLLKYSQPGRRWGSVKLTWSSKNSQGTRFFLVALSCISVESSTFGSSL